MWTPSARLVLKDPRLLHESRARRGRQQLGSAHVAMRQTSGKMGSSRCCARWAPTTCSTPSTGRACRARSKRRGMLHAMGARRCSRRCVMGPCETLNAAGLALLFELGAELADEHGERLAPVALLLQTYVALSAGQASLSSNWSRAGHRNARHAADGGASRAHRSARSAPAPRPASARSNVLARRDLSA